MTTDLKLAREDDDLLDWLLLGRVAEQAKATFNINPSIVTALGTLVVFLLVAIPAMLARR